MEEDHDTVEDGEAWGMKSGIYEQEKTQHCCVPVKKTQISGA